MKFHRIIYISWRAPTKLKIRLEKTSKYIYKKGQANLADTDSMASKLKKLTLFLQYKKTKRLLILNMNISKIKTKQKKHYTSMQAPKKKS